MKSSRIYLFLLPISILASFYCQTQSKNSEVAATKTEIIHPAGDPWFASARLGDWSKLEQLKIDLNRDWDYSKKGVTALMVAARNGQLTFIKNLLGKNVKINRTDELKYNALSYAIHGSTISEKKQQTCRLLVENGADAFSEDQFQLTPLQIMIELGFIDCLKAVKLTETRPCDQAKRLNHIKSLVEYAEAENEDDIVTYLKSQGCK